MLARLEDPEYRSPTRVVKFTPDARDDDRVTEIYVNDGEELSGGTVAAPRGDLLVIGAYADRKMLLCTQGANAPPRNFGGPEKET